jgi:hypothetical protein
MLFILLQKRVLNRTTLTCSINYFLMKSFSFQQDVIRFDRSTSRLILGTFEYLCGSDTIALREKKNK